MIYKDDATAAQYVHRQAPGELGKIGVCGARTGLGFTRLTHQVTCPDCKAMMRGE
jgi:rubredoxin